MNHRATLWETALGESEVGPAFFHFLPSDTFLDESFSSSVSSRYLLIIRAGKLLLTLGQSTVWKYRMHMCRKEARAVMSRSLKVSSRRT